MTKLDRLGRSLRHLLNLMADLERRHIDLQVIDQGLDTSTPAGKLISAVIGAVAEFERDLISERTRAGLDAARARGRKGGRRPVITPDKARVAREMYDSREYTVDQIANTIGVSRATVYRSLGEDPEPDNAGTFRRWSRAAVVTVAAVAGIGSLAGGPVDDFDLRSPGALIVSADDFPGFPGPDLNAPESGLVTTTSGGPVDLETGMTFRGWNAPREADKLTPTQIEPK